MSPAGSSTARRLSALPARVVQVIGRRTVVATLVVSVATAIAKVASAGKDLVVAARFGRSDPLEAFLNASVVPFVVVVVLAGAVTSAFMATYIEVREREGRGAAHALVSSVSLLSLLILAAASLLLLLATDLILGPLGANFGAPKLALMRELYILLLPIIPLSGLAMVWSGVLNAEGRFALAALAPLAIPILTAAAVLALTGGIGGFALAYGTLAGYLLQALVLAGTVRGAGLPILPRWYGWNPHLSRIARLYVPAAAAALLMSSSLIVDQSMAAMLREGSVAALNYGTKLVALVTGLGATAIATGLLPRLSELVVARQWAAIRHLVRTYAALIAAVTVPVAGVFFFGSAWIVSTLYERGTFTADDARVVARVQSLMVLQLPAYAIGMIFVSLITALRHTRVFLWGNLLNVSCNVAFNYVLMQRYGVAGIALATSIVITISCAFVWIAGMRLLRAAERSGPPADTSAAAVIASATQSLPPT